ncbi:Indole-3-glycerol phosphate synthase [Paraliobacillus sp. PM-2]|uniref:indole-3-glycerol phosphate synthase TrpC n=1 Tax=Paraliobacillus sp. PM-2 TaxID=1462524 RepID=UPI00061BC6F8|nr:indole-3-glycerol phosphate synthase TrpC [Paraliobacillus sp. PM-2]CQR46076.1 Indole-3-glycerol phosphate synthase [Paraliobacillus sp. PM-2]
MTILDDILKEKAKEVEVLKKFFQVNEKKNFLPKRSLFKRFMKHDHMNIIAEIKRASPSRGIINEGVVPSEQAVKYKNHGAGAISVLTDEPFFKGTMDDLSAVREKVDIPILNKDFIIDEIQIDRAKNAGADVILLIAAALPAQRLQELFEYAINADLEVLFEVHNEEELTVAQSIGASIIGVNNRNLKTFDVDLATTERLAEQIDTSNTLLISESGIKTTADVERVKQAGAKGILVGETMMRSQALDQTFTQLQIKL